MIPILNAPAANLPLVGSNMFSMIPRPTISQDMAMLSAISANLVRIEVPWIETETTAGVYTVPDWVEGRIAAARNSGKQVILVLDYGNTLYMASVFTPPTTAAQLTAFNNFAKFVAGAYPDAILEVWNEPNNPTFWAGAPSASQYAALLNSVVPAIKAGYPNAKIVTAGVGDLLAPGINATPFMTSVMATLTTTVKGQLYAHTLHPYNNTKPEDLFTYIDAYRAATSYTGPILISEWGYCWPWISNNETTRAIFAARMICCCACAGIIGLTFYNLRDTGTDTSVAENTFGLHNYGMSAKSAVTTIKSMMAALAGSVTYDAEKLADGAYRLTLRKANGAVVKVLWTDLASISHVDSMDTVTDVRGALGTNDGFRFKEGVVTITLVSGAPPIIITGT